MSHGEIAVHLYATSVRPKVNLLFKRLVKLTCRVSQEVWKY